MRQLGALLTLALAATMLSAEQGGGKVEVKGPHLCCKVCVTTVGKILGGVAGVSDAKSDIDAKMVTFTAKDDKAAAAGFKALIDSGLFGTATCAGKEVKVELPAVKGAKAAVVTVKDVHVCCGQCQTAIDELFKGSKVTYEAKKGAQKTVRIEGKNLDPAAVLETLHKTGFHGTVGK